MRITRCILWALVFISAIGAVYLYINDDKISRGSVQISAERLGGDFELTRHDGGKIGHGDLLGSPHAVFFGFTNCPEVCPTTLFEITSWLAELGEDGDRVKVYFITVDPARDTPEILSEYLSSFDPRIIGISGNKKAVERSLKAFKVYFKRAELEDGDYTMDHTTIIYLLNSMGEFAGSISYGEDQQSAVSKLRRLID